jgi:hypothetical protein
MYIDARAMRRVRAIITIIRHAVTVGIGIGGQGATGAVDRSSGRRVWTQIDFVGHAICIAIDHRWRLRLDNTGCGQQ